MLGNSKRPSYIDLTNRLENVEDDAVLQLARSLHPRFKSMKSLPRGKRETVWNLLRNLLLGDSADDEPLLKKRSIRSAPSTSLAFHYSFERDDEETAATRSSAAYELRLYRDSPSETNIDKYPLRFWQTNQAVYPRLSKLAMQYLCPPASSVPVECLFSAAGELISKKRNSLASHNANTLLSLHCWLQDYH